MKHRLLLLITLLTVSLGASAQSWTNFNSYGVQRKIAGSDTLYRIVGSSGMGLPFEMTKVFASKKELQDSLLTIYSKAKVDSILATGYYNKTESDGRYLYTAGTNLQLIGNTLSTVSSPYFTTLTTTDLINTGASVFGISATLVRPNAGPILTLGAITGGSGYTDGVYNNVAATVTPSGGLYARLNVTVSGGAVTAVTIASQGARFVTGDVLTVAPANIGGTGSGFSVLVSTTRTVALYVSKTQGVTSSAIRLERNDMSVSAGMEIGSILFSTLDASANGSGDAAYLRATTIGSTGGANIAIGVSANANNVGSDALLINGTNKKVTMIGDAESSRVIPVNLNIGVAGTDSLVVHDNTSNELKRIAPLSITTTGSGAATYSASTNTLNIPTPVSSSGTGANTFTGYQAFNGGIGATFTAKSANYSLALTDFAIEATNGGYTFTLPGGAVPSGQIFIIKGAPIGSVSSSPTLIASSGSLEHQTIGVNLSLGEAESVVLQSTGAGAYNIVGRYTPNTFNNYTASGTGAATTITIPHGLTSITATSKVIVQPLNAASAGVSYATIGTTNISIIYTVAPANGTNNLNYSILIKP